MKLPSSPIKTTAGAGAAWATIVGLIINVIIPPMWPWWAHQSSQWLGAVQAVTIGAGAYFGSVLAVWLHPDKTTTMTMGSVGPIPVVDPVPEPVPAPVPH